MKLPVIAFHFAEVAPTTAAPPPPRPESVARSFIGWFGSAAASAIAAEAPQIAVAPPLSRPNRVWKPISRAASIDTPIVSATVSTTIAIGCQPRSAIWPSVMRKPEQRDAEAQQRAAR